MLPQQQQQSSSTRKNKNPYNIRFKTNNNRNTNATNSITPSNEDDEELADLISQLNQANLPTYAKTVVSRDIKRLRKLTPSAPESGILRSDLELVAALPWQQQQSSSATTHTDDVSIAVAQKHLNADHYG